MNDREYMKIALRLAEKGAGKVSPNPMVGAVIVKDGRIIGRGFHEKYGEAHAERNALSSCTESPKDAEMYVTLEPCCHYGKQPPCTEAIVKSGIKRVIVGSGDPNPLVSGKGIDFLRKHGIEVTENVFREECDRLNEVFFHYIKTKRPFVIMKYAMTMDGKIAAYTGESKWITGEAARKHAHKNRNRCTAIMVGVGTVLADDPMLTCRIPDGKNPIRIICDTELNTPLASQVVATAEQIPTIIATCCENEKKIAAYENFGCRIMNVHKKYGHTDLAMLMEQLGRENIDSILLEGGGTLNWSALKSGIVQKVHTYISPKIFGGVNAKTPVEGIGVSSPSEAFTFRTERIIRLGGDILVESEVISHVYGNC